MARIYCSGPLFCAEEVGGMTAIAQVLEAAGHTTFLPHRDGLEPYVLRFGGVPAPGVRQAVERAVFAIDVYELVERCDAVVCNLNGRVPDEGAVVEATLAYSIGKPLILYKSDARAAFGGRDNAMITALGPYEDRIERLPARVAGLRKGPRGKPSAALAESIAIGAKLSALLAQLPPDLGKQRWMDAVIERVSELLTGEAPEAREG